jgi:hypothetical protein
MKSMISSNGVENLVYIKLPFLNGPGRTYLNNAVKDTGGTLSSFASLTSAVASPDDAFSSSTLRSLLASLGLREKKPRLDLASGALTMVAFSFSSVLLGLDMIEELNHGMGGGA